jgi:hypothetical protein
MLHGAQCVEHINSIRPNKTCGNKSKGDVWKTQDTGCRNKLRQSSIRLQRILLPDMLLMEAQMGTHRWIENAYVSMLASHLFIHIDVNDIAQQRNWAGRIYLESSTSRWSPIRGARKKKWIEHTNFSHIVQYNAKELSETRVYAEQMQCYNGWSIEPQLGMHMANRNIWDRKVYVLAAILLAWRIDIIHNFACQTMAMVPE